MASRIGGVHQNVDARGVGMDNKDFGGGENPADSEEAENILR